ncbi:unnamed protein product [Nezara viridula]|uniref:Uncharacterized protein n=1 Tax=Nezara viridula TaxID=85310 RepID=A0A9P0MEF0_NEZVI|nr:unnamed protein product [Nezara viridula]
MSELSIVLGHHTDTEVGYPSINTDGIIPLTLSSLPQLTHTTPFGAQLTGSFLIDLIKTPSGPGEESIDMLGIAL